MFHPRQKHTIVRFDQSDDAVESAARRLRKLAQTTHGADWRIAAARSLTRDTSAVLIERSDSGRTDQWYALRIRPNGIRLRAVGHAGLHYGVTTLGQLLASGRKTIRAMDIEDWPDFPVRGVMLDISRDKVPTMSTLKELIDMLAGWKLNQLQLYTEHTFAYPGHETVWRGASPLTARQIEELDGYCRRRCMELVPNQNSFGHMERWLKHPNYADLAESRGGWKTPWGERRTRPATLNPLDPGSIRLVADLYGKLLPHFTSRLFNVGCDETWELGQGRSRNACKRRGHGRVYFDFHSRIHRLVRRHGRRMMFWSDMVQAHPELIPELHEEVIPLVWGYEADFPFGRCCAPLAAAGLSFYVCPGTSSWCSFGGRSRNSLANLRNAAEAGKRYRAAGYLITDWGDYGHRQYLPASYSAFLYGAAVSWCFARNSAVNVPRELSRHVFGDLSGVTGRLWRDVGAVHEVSGVSLNNRTILFDCMQGKLHDVSCVEGLSIQAAARMFRRIDEIESRVPGARFNCEQGALIKRELLATLAILRHAARRAATIVTRRRGRRARSDLRWLARDIPRIMERHRTLWRARNRRGGLAHSLGYYRRIQREYE